MCWCYALHPTTCHRRASSWRTSRRPAEGQPGRVIVPLKVRIHGKGSQLLGRPAKLSARTRGSSSSLSEEDFISSPSDSGPDDDSASTSSLLNSASLPLSASLILLIVSAVCPIGTPNKLLRTGVPTGDLARVGMRRSRASRWRLLLVLCCFARRIPAQGSQGRRRKTRRKRRPYRTRVIGSQPPSTGPAQVAESQPGPPSPAQLEVATQGLLRGIELFNDGHTAEGVAELGRAVMVAPTVPGGAVTYYRALRSQHGRLAEAVAWGRWAASLQPTNADVAAEVGRLLVQHGGSAEGLDESARLFRFATDLVPSSGTFWHDRGTGLSRTGGRVAEQRHCHTRAAELFHGSPRLAAGSWLETARTAVAYAEADYCFAKAVAAAPGDNIARSEWVGTLATRTRTLNAGADGVRPDALRSTIASLAEEARTVALASREAPHDRVTHHIAMALSSIGPHSGLGRRLGQERRGSAARSERASERGTMRPGERSSPGTKCAVSRWPPRPIVSCRVPAAIQAAQQRRWRSWSQC